MCYLIACKIAELEDIPIACRYLECSRYAWRMAEFALPDADPIEKICIGGVHVTLRKILMRGGLTDSEACDVAKVLKKEKELDKQLSYEEIQKLKPFLTSCSLLKMMIKNHAGAAYDITMRYFVQEGLYAAEPFAIVDSGWTGSLQLTLKRLLQSGRCKYSSRQKEEKPIKVQGFYFGLYELPEGVNPKDYHTYYFQPYQDTEKKTRFSNCLFEAVCSAREGMTLGYREESGRIAAVYETMQNPNAERIIENEALLERMLASEDLLKKITLPVQEVQNRLENLMSSPTVQEVLDYGGYLFSDDVFCSSLQRVAARLSQKEIRNLHYIRRVLIMMGLKKAELKNSAWPEGSVVLSGDRVAYHLFQVRMYKRMVYYRKKLQGRKERYCKE